MEREEILERLKKWESVITDLMITIEAFCELTGSNYESPFINSIMKVVDEYTEQVAFIIGDESDALEWFMLENDMGKATI